MGVSRQAPGWLTWVLAGGLALVFLGERILPGIAAARLVATGLGTLLVLASAAWRMVDWRQARRAGAPDEARLRAELALAALGCVLVLALYFLTTDTGISLLRLDFADEAARGRYRTALQVAWVTLAAVSLLPALVAALAPGRRPGGGGGGAEVLETARVREGFNSGLVIALAGALLFVVGFVATRRDRFVDLGYFRTSSPGTATTALVRSLHGPLQVLLFFPDASPVKREVEDYFHALARSGAPLHLEEHDRLTDPEATRRFDVRDDGTVVLTGNGKTQRMVLPVDMDAARLRLRTLDRDVQAQLMDIVRRPRVAYLTIGHGELNDTVTYQSAGGVAQQGLGGVDALRALLRYLNYDVKDLGLSAGLARDVPSDASLVLVLGPRRSFLPEELAALDRFLVRGGSLMLALQPRTDFRLGALEQRLGVRFDGVPLADDQQYVRRRGDRTDRGLLITDRFSSHDAVRTASLAGPGGAALFPDPGRLQRVDSTAAHPTVVVRSLPTAFLDRNGDYALDGAQEKRDEYPLAAAVQADSGRALVYADAEMFTDAVLSSLRVNASLAMDGIRWLGREEALSGTTVSEEDVPIQHTRAQDVGWFYSTILGAPALVLAFGLFGVRRHRRTGRSGSNA